MQKSPLEEWEQQSAVHSLGFKGWGGRGYWALRKLWGNLILAFQYLKGADKQEGEWLLIWVHSDRPKGNGFKPEEGRFRSDVRRKFCLQSVVRRWHSCPEKLRVPHPWRHSRPGWMVSWAAWADGGQPCPRQGVGIGWALRVLPTQAILWFSDSTASFRNSGIPLILQLHYLKLSYVITYKTY